MLTWAKHPVLKPPSDEMIAKMSDKELLEIYEIYHEAIKNAQEDPLRYGFTIEPWEDADKLMDKFDEVLVFGGNRASKTVYGARSVVKAAIENPESIILCFAQDAASSVRVQQKSVYDWLPAEFKVTTRSATGYIKYSLKNGFTGDSLILPDVKSKIYFHTYSQFLNNPGKFEGLEVGSVEPQWRNLGIWLDEYLLGSDLVNTLRFRLATRNAKMLLTFTPINGITEFLASYLKGVETVETRKAELLENKEVPYIQHSKYRNAGIVYFHSQWNPFGGYDRLVRDLLGRPKDEIMTRAYGIPKAILTGQFPLFSRRVNVISEESMQKILDDTHNVTLYMGIDPAPNKRWFMIWVAVASDGTWYIYREWPDIGYGPWAEIGQNGKSRFAEASKPDGKGIADYVNLIRELEQGEKINERIIDPRMGATPRQIEEGTTTIIDQLAEHDLFVIPSLGTGGNVAEITAGIASINNLLSYDNTKEIDAINRPSLYISESCENTIDALLNYTASEGPNEAWKDPIDVIRYLAFSEIYYMEPGNHGVSRIKQGGY